jgi:bacterioferritin
MRAYQTASLPERRSRPRAGSELTAQLDEALAAKLVELLRTRRHHFLARSGGSSHAVDVFLAHSIAAQGHADALAARIIELGAQPGFSPALLARSPGGWFAPVWELRDMAHEDLEATRATGAVLKALLIFVGATDPITRRLLLAILADDKARAKVLAALIASPGANS